MSKMFKPGDTVQRISAGGGESKIPMNTPVRVRGYDPLSTCMQVETIVDGTYLGAIYDWRFKLVNTVQPVEYNESEWE